MAGLRIPAILLALVVEEVTLAKPLPMPGAGSPVDGGSAGDAGIDVA